MDWNNLPVNEEIPVFRLYLPDILQDNHLNFEVDVEETPLTKALRGGSFKEAEKIIKENTDNELLNQGPFTSTPLALVLSGDPDNRSLQCHLGLAKLLVECGADVNHRVLASHNKLSPSPMEYLVQLIFETKAAIRNDTENEEQEDDWLFPFSPLQTVGLNNEPNLEGSTLIKQMLSLLDIFLEHGGNPNVRTTQNESTLYHMVLSEPEADLELALKLCEGGGNLNTPNRHVTTPLMDLILQADYDDALDVLHNIWERNSDISSLNSVNVNNESALWRAMIACSPKVAVELLHKGADCSSWASVVQGKWYFQARSEDLNIIEPYVRKNGVSPICAPLLQNSSAYGMYSSVSISNIYDDTFEFKKTFNVDLVNKIMAASIFPVVDNISQSSLFDSTTVHHLEKQLDLLTSFNLGNLIPPLLMQNIAHLLFGNLKAGLQQMCVRRIVHQMLFNQNADGRKKLLTKLMDDGIEFEKPEENVIDEWDIDFTLNPRKDERNEIVNNIIKPNGDDWIFVKTITSEMVTKMVSSYLDLPSALVPRFFIEIVRLQLAASLFLCERDCTLDDDSDSFEQYLLERNNYDVDYDVDTNSLSNSDYVDSEDDDYKFWFGPDGPNERDFNWAKTVVPPQNGSISENSQETGQEMNSEKSSSIDQSAETENSTACGVDALNINYVEFNTDTCISSSDTTSNEEPDCVN